MFEKYNKIISLIIQPIRITLFVSLLCQFFKTDMSSDPSLLFFYWFIPLYASSFVIDLVLTSRKGFVQGVKSLSIKYAQLLPVEFAGIAGFALLTFAPHAIGILLAIKVSLVVIICEIGIEGYHKFIVPHLNRIKPTPQMATLMVIGMTVTTFFMGFYFLALSEHHLVFPS
ncbi:MAG: hypothetical protein ACREAD_01025 [Nitrosopumilaceae archaeon]